MTKLRFHSHKDPRGSLLPLDLQELPLVPRRIFFVTDVPPGTIRAGHGPARGSQLLIGTSGLIKVIIQRATGDQEKVALGETGEACLLQKGDVAWIRYCTADAQLCVLSDMPFDPDEYVYSDSPPTSDDWVELFQ